MAKRVFKPASRQQIMNRAEDALRSWSVQFEKRRGVTKNPDGSYDVKGDLNLYKDPIFRDGGFDPVLIQKYMRFGRVSGRFSARPSEFFLVLPRKVRGDAHMIGSLSKCIVRSGCNVAGKVVVTLMGY